MSISNDGTELLSASSTFSFANSWDVARFVEEHLNNLKERRILTIVIKQVSYEEPYAATVTIESLEDTQTLSCSDEQQIT